MSPQAIAGAQVTRTYSRGSGYPRMIWGSGPRTSESQFSLSEGPVAAEGELPVRRSAGQEAGRGGEVDPGDHGVMHEVQKSRP